VGGDEALESLGGLLALEVVVDEGEGAEAVGVDARVAVLSGCCSTQKASGRCKRHLHQAQENTITLTSRSAEWGV
jgi:hypothetical protein